MSYEYLYKHGLLDSVDIHGIGIQSPLQREAYAREGLRLDQDALEIAPLCTPLLAQGLNVKNVDVNTREQNIERLNGSWPQTLWPSDWKDHFVEVHYIWKGEKYSTLIKDKKFSRAVGSHVIEHIPDLVTFINDLHDLLLPGGEVRMIVPDMRFNWDRKRRPTELVDIIGNYLEERARPTWDTYFEQVLFAPESLTLSFFLPM